eukprot:1144041-Pleurochrysis_carterae.AAC.1
MREAQPQRRSRSSRSRQILAGGKSASGMGGADVQGASFVVRTTVLAHDAPAGASMHRSHAAQAAHDQDPDAAPLLRVDHGGLAAGGPGPSDQQRGEHAAPLP